MRKTYNESTRGAFDEVKETRCKRTEGASGLEIICRISANIETDEKKYWETNTVDVRGANDML